MFTYLYSFRDLRPLVPPDIILLEYIANKHLISKLEGNETVSLKFSKKLKIFKREQVSRDCKSFNSVRTYGSLHCRTKESEMPK